MKTIAWTVKTRTGKLIPSWIFETEEEAKDFCSELNEKYRPHKNYVFPVLIEVGKLPPPPYVKG